MKMRFNKTKVPRLIIPRELFEENKEDIIEEVSEGVIEEMEKISGRKGKISFDKIEL